MPGDWLRHPCARVLISIVFSSVSNKSASQFLDFLYEVPAFHTTSNSATNRRDVPARQIRVQITQMVLKILQGFALGHVIRKLLQITEPELAILPVNVSKTFHTIKVQLSLNLGNVIVPANAAAEAEARACMASPVLRRKSDPNLNRGGLRQVIGPRWKRLSLPMVWRPALARCRKRKASISPGTNQPQAHKYEPNTSAGAFAPCPAAPAQTALR